MKPEIIVELSGSLVEWSPRLSSRKNVFLVSTYKGDQILLQKDFAYNCAEWFFAIKGAINKLVFKANSNLLTLILIIKMHHIVFENSQNLLSV